MKKNILLLCLLLNGCDDSPTSNSDNNPPNELNIYDIFKQNTQLEKDINNIYHFVYEPSGTSESDYGTLKYMTNIPVTRVFWSSPDSFFVNYQNQLIGEPIINNSTYSGNDGLGQQLFYVSSESIGDTLKILGYIYSNDVDTILVLVEQ